MSRSEPVPVAACATLSEPNPGTDSRRQRKRGAVEADMLAGAIADAGVHRRARAEVEEAERRAQALAEAAAARAQADGRAADPTGAR